MKPKAQAIFHIEFNVYGDFFPVGDSQNIGNCGKFGFFEMVESCACLVESEIQLAGLFALVKRAELPHCRRHPLQLVVP